MADWMSTPARRVFLVLAGVILQGVLLCVFCSRPLVGSRRDSTRALIDDTAMRALRATMEGRCPSLPTALSDHEVDHWGRDLRVLCDPTSLAITVVSAGDDGRFGTADDMSNR